MSSPSKIASKKPMSFWIHMIISTAIMFGFGFLPPIAETITPFGMRVLGILIGLCYGWILIDFTWPSLLALIALGLTNYTTIGGAFITGISNENTITILLIFVLAAYVQHTGALSYVTTWIVSRKVLVGRPWLFTMAFICAAIPIAIFVNAFAGIIMLYAMFETICTAVGLEKKDFYVTYVCFGIANLGALLSIAFPFQPFSIIAFNLAGPKNGIAEIPFMEWTIFGFAAIVAFSVTYYILGRFILRVDVSKLNNMGDEFKQYRDVKMNGDQKFGLFILALFVILVVLPSVTSGALQVFFKNFGVHGAVITCVAVAILYQYWKGKELYSFAHMVRDGVNWELLILFLAALPVCNALESADAGVITTIVNTIMPFVNSVSPVVFLVVVSVLFCTITQISHNIVLIIALVPSLAKIAVGVGLNPVVFGLFFTLCCQIAVVTPAASAAAAMAFGHSKWVETKHAYKMGICLFFTWLLTAVCIMLPVILFVF